MISGKPGHARRDKKRYKMVYQPDSFGDWVRYRRKLLDLTQSELAHHAGCSTAAIRKIEADERKPSRQLAELLRQALEISPEEQTVFLQMARGRLPESFAVQEAQPTPSLAAGEHPNNLPAPLTQLINRHHDLGLVVKMLTDPAVRLVTLIGPPGIGKTRLSIQSGQSVLPAFQDGVWFVDVSEVTMAEFLLPAIARVIETCEMPPCPALPQLARNLKGKTLLLILDNFEQIAEDAAPEVSQLLQRCPGVKALITSRVPLRIYGEHEYSLPPLSIPPAKASKHAETLMEFEAVQLFTARVRQHQPEFALSSQNASAVVAICNLLEGIPLALELAAATLQNMPLDEMVARLHSGAGSGWIRQLATPARDLPSRQRTLENVIAWSYDLLEASEREFFAALSIFSGWFDAQAAQAVVFETAQLQAAESERWLEHLSDHSLLVRGKFNQQRCWRMLEIIHEFAAMQLSAQARSQLEQRHGSYYLGQLGSTLYPVTEGFLETHLSNLHAALRWAVATQNISLAFQLAQGLLVLWDTTGNLREGLALMQQVLALPGEVEPALRVRVTAESSDLAWQQYDFDAALKLSQLAVQQARQWGLSDLYPEYLNRLGRIFMEQGLYDEAGSTLRESLALLPEPGRPLTQLGELAWYEGRLEDAAASLQQALSRLPEGDHIFRAIALTDLAEVAMAEGDFAACRLWLQQAWLPAGVNIRRVLVFLIALAGYLLLAPSSDQAASLQAARIFGAIEALSELSGVQLSAFYQRLIQQRMDSNLHSINSSEWQAAYLAGQQLGRDEAMLLARNVLGV